MKINDPRFVNELDRQIKVGFEGIELDLVGLGDFFGQVEIEVVDEMLTFELEMLLESRYFLLAFFFVYFFELNFLINVGLLGFGI